MLKCETGVAGANQQPTRHLVSSMVNVAYPTDDYNIDHASTRRKLQTAHPSAGVHARRLTPPVLSNPVMLAARNSVDGTT